MKGGTFTISNLGMYDIETFTAIINPPECCIMAVGSMIKKPVVVDDEIVIRPMMNMSFSFDHRIIDGAPAAEFVKRLKGMIENPMDILL